jgi:hypothetical protein
MTTRGITPVQKPQPRRVKSGGGKLGEILAGVGAVAGAFTGNPVGGAAAGATTGHTLGNIIDPVRTKTVQSAPQSMGPIAGGKLVSQKHKLSQAGHMAMEALQVAKAVPEYQEYQQTLAIAIMKDIAANNKQRMG